MFDQMFLRKKAIPKKLEDYGFQKHNDIYEYSAVIIDKSFHLKITINKNGIPDTTLTEIATGEEYMLYKTNATNSFIGNIRSAISDVLQDVCDKCYEFAVFKSEQSLNLIEYVHRKYKDELEYLWERFPDNAIWRRKDNKKWYGALLKVSLRKLGVDSDEVVEIIDLRGEAEVLMKLINNKIYYPGWHMNKKHWYSVVLDGSLDIDELFARLDESYSIAKDR